MTDEVPGSWQQEVAEHLRLARSAGEEAYALESLAAMYRRAEKRHISEARALAEANGQPDIRRVSRSLREPGGQW